ncbi:hypothetical protein [Allosalinactinospora lopnorensis]|uniref:hypothetical protein n=1 Tax=Allosalinactinospora lopnorensis TaxID=1352348 RepID=UPI000623E6BA|nr:hypothetical protein [Allosalinactinospora lopnorensis]
MFRKLGVAGLVAGAALGVLISAVPAQADHGSKKKGPIICFQQQAQEANSDSNAVSENTNTNANENAAATDAGAELVAVA